MAGDLTARRRRAVIIGGGIAGLAAALRLQELAPASRIVLLEAEGRLGGKIRTERSDGFVIEGAPDSFLSSKPQAVALARELGIEDRLQGVRQDTRRTFVMRNGQLVQLPEGLSGLVPARLGPLFRSPLLSPRGKLRVTLERFIPARRDGEDESLGSFMRRRMGREAYERLIEPLMSGIYGGNGDELSIAATFPRLQELERSQGSLLKALSQTEPHSSGWPRSPFLAPVNGMAELVEAMARRLESVEIRCDAAATAIRKVEGRYAVIVPGVHALEADAVVLATPAYASARLLEDIDAGLAQELVGIPYGSTTIVSLAYAADDLPRPLNGHGYIVPRRENRSVLACTWTSSKFEHRAPAGRVLFRAFLGGGKSNEMLKGDAELIELVRSELRSTLAITAKPALTRVARWPNSMPQYLVGHVGRLERIDRRLKRLPGLFIAGAAYRGVGIPDCIQSGYDAAQAAARVLGHD